jgi:hypothetical protein
MTFRQTTFPVHFDKRHLDNEHSYKTVSSFQFDFTLHVHTWVQLALDFPNKSDQIMIGLQLANGGLKKTIFLFT